VKCVIAICFVFLAFVAHAQTSDISAEGKVTNMVSGKGVKAKIFYKSLPTGSITGRFNDSTFSFLIFGTAKYLILAEAPGFLPASAIVDPKDIDANHKVIRDIQLTPEGQTVRLNTLNFDQGKAIINPKSYPGLDEIVAMMKENGNMVIQLEGHTDSSGDAAANKKISEERVEVVKKYLTSKGIPKDRVKTKAFGGTQPLSPDRSAKAQSLNRRVEMRILKN
jgi:outer membrane protein OmpA-like peptidoglycan-associated protein